MTEQQARNLMMDYLFDEMDNTQKKEFETLLKNRPDLLEELQELRQTRELLQFVPQEQSTEKLLFLSPESDSEKQQPFDKRPRIFLHPVVTAVLAAAASVLIILFASSVTGLQVGQTEHGFYLTFDEPPVQTETDGGMTEHEVYALMEQMQHENTLLLTSLMEQVQQQQEEQLHEVIGVLTQYYDERRRRDLMLIADGLNQLESETQYRFSQTDEALGSIIYALSNP